MDDLALLKLIIDWGADEALLDAPIDRFSIPALQSNQTQNAPPRPSPSLSLVMSPTAALDVARSPGRPNTRPPAAVRAADLAASANTVDKLRAALAAFDGCGLRDTATNLVFADGNPLAELMLVGEGPGAEEDRAGKPFVGRSGQLLDKMFASIGITRDNCLITNLIPWRPPGNRTPTDTEVSLCLPFLQRHIALTRPRHLVLLGGLASQALLGSTIGIRRLRGRWHAASIPGLPEPVPALPMLHPAYLLRTPGAKRDTWADLLRLRRTLDAGNGRGSVLEK
jgi:DNA polymerase